MSTFKKVVLYILFLTSFTADFAAEGFQEVYKESTFTSEQLQEKGRALYNRLRLSYFLVVEQQNDLQPQDTWEKYFSFENKRRRIQAFVEQEAKKLNDFLLNQCGSPPSGKMWTEHFKKMDQDALFDSIALAS